MKKEICVLIRVFDRIEDLVLNLSIIRKLWINYDYNILIMSNGNSHGFEIPQCVFRDANKVVALSDNVGHLKGNSQLLVEGSKYINWDAYDYVVILEADTWICKDSIIDKYVHALDESSAVWASARWYDRYESLATDFAIIKTSFFKNNIDIFDFENYPECHVCNYLIQKNIDYIYIKESMPTMLPGYIKKYPFAPQGRFNIFWKSKIVTHHIEQLKYGMEEKKAYFNYILGWNFFKTKYTLVWWSKFYFHFSYYFHFLLIRRSWFIGSKKQFK